MRIRYSLFVVPVFLILSEIIYANHKTLSVGYNNKLYYTVQTSANIISIKEYDFTTATTIKTFESGVRVYGIYVNNLDVLGIVAGDKLYIQSNYYKDGVNTTVIWSYDGTTFESVFTVTSSESNGWLYMGSPFVYEGKLLFSLGSSSSSSDNLWGQGFAVYSLTGSDTTKVFTTASANQYNNNFEMYGSHSHIVSGNNIYFAQSAYISGTNIYYLKKYNGSSIETLNTSSNGYSALRLFNSKLYWNQYAYSNNVSTHTIKYLDPSNGSTGGGGSGDRISISEGNLYGPVVFGSKLVYYINYWSDTKSSEIVSYDGTSVSTLVSGSNTGGYIGYGNFLEYQNRLIWAASGSGRDGNYKLYAYDGSSVYEPQNTSTPPTKLSTETVVYSATPYSNKQIGTAYEINDILYFPISDYSASANNLEWWSYNIAAPVFASGYPVASNISDENFEIKVKTDKAGTVYYVVLADGATAPTAAEVKAGTGSSGETAVTSSNTTLSADTEKTVSFSTSISANTSYDVYVVVEDNFSSPLLQSSATLVEVATSANALPIFASGSPSVSVGSLGTSATLSVTADVIGTAYYVLLANNAAEPSTTDVKNGTGKAGGSTYTNGSFSITENTASTATFSGLTESTEYDAWVVLEDASSNIQTSATRVNINTDKTSPTITAPTASGITTTTFDFGFKINESGTGYYVVLLKGGSSPTATQIKNGKDFSGNTDSVSVSASVNLQENVENSVSVTGLNSETQYTLYLAADDDNANLANISTGVDVTTVAVPQKYTISSSGTISGGSASDYTTIQAGIAVAKVSTDTLVVSAGTYTENIDFGGKDIYIKSASGAASTIIQPQNTGIPIVSFIGNETSSAALIGFTLTGGGTVRGSALQFNNSSPIIENCIITSSSGEGAVSFYYSSAVLKNCVIYNNASSNPLYFDVSNSSPEFINCTIANNSGYGAGYSSPSLTTAPIFRNCILWGNSSGGASGRYTIENSIVEGGFPSGTSVLSSDPLFANATNGDLSLTDYSPAIGTANSSTATVDDIIDAVRGSPPDIGAYENSRSTPLSDTDSPIVTYVKEGTTGNLEWVGVSNKLSAHWNGNDAASGIKEYEYALDTSATTVTGSIVAWTSAGTDTSITMTDLSLVEGKTYYVSVRATDMLNNVSSVVTSDGVKLDVTAPAIGSIVVGTDNHLQWTNDTTSVTATWSGFSDGSSGIKEYEVMIRDSTSKINETDWVIVADGTLSHTFTGLDLDNNSQYLLKARASDKVGNLSSTVESDLFHVDSEKPLVSSVYECHEDNCNVEDLDWFGPNSGSFRLAWVANDNGIILEHQLAIGTSQDIDDVMTRFVPLDPMTSENGDSLSWLTGEDYKEGQLYYTNIQVKDKAGNLSGIVSSDGFQIDGSPPNTGEVNDGEGEDLDFSPSTSSITVSWDGFDDLESGIDHYRVSLGMEPGEDDIRSNVEVKGDQKVKTFTGLYLNHGETYYSSVVAVDLVGNESKLVTSDGFAVDEYPGPPSITDVSHENDVFLSLVSDEELVFYYSEPVMRSEIKVSSIFGTNVNFNSVQAGDSIVVNIKHPLTSLDTLNVIIGEMTDMSGRVAEDTLFTFYTEMLADYNHDLSIDAADLAILAGAWGSQDYFFELGPVEGEAPHFVPNPDGGYDLRDIMTYTRMWHWDHQTPKVLNLARTMIGQKIEVSMDETSLRVTVPESTVAGQLGFQISGTETFLTLPEEQSDEMILLSHDEPTLKQSIIDFAYLSGKGERDFVLPLKFGRESSIITLVYVLYDLEGAIVGEGVKSIDVTPLPAEFVLDQNYPNPFNPTTRIEYGLPVNSKVDLTIYDLLGQEVRSLLSRDARQAGYYNTIWDARDERGLMVSAGVYIYRLTARGEDGKRFTLTKKMILLK